MFPTLVSKALTMMIIRVIKLYSSIKYQCISFVMDWTRKKVTQVLSLSHLSEVIFGKISYLIVCFNLIQSRVSPSPKSDCGEVYERKSHVLKICVKTTL